MNDVMDGLLKQNGPVNSTIEYLGKVNGQWLGGAGDLGQPDQGTVSRIDLMKQLAGIDVQEMYPAGAPPKADNWTFDTFLKAAEACHKGGYPFGIGLGTAGDNVDTAGAIFNGYGAMLVDAKGNITVKSDPVRQALDYYKRLAAFLPPDAPSWDDASNNKWLISGRGALIMNPPSAWAVAKRDAPKICEQLWTHGFAAGPKGRFAPFVQFFWSVWNFGKNQSAAKSLIVHLSQQASAEKWSRRAADMTCRPSTTSRPSKPGPRRRRPRARSSTIPIRTSTRSCRSRPSLRRTRSASRSRCRRCRRRWWCATSKARQWRRRWPGLRASSKDSCGDSSAQPA